MGHLRMQWGKFGFRRIESSELDDAVTHTDGKFVCANCFGDDGVKNFIGNFDPKDDEWDTCSYCKSPQGLHLDWVSEYIYDTYFRELLVPADSVFSFDYEEGRYRGNAMDTADAIEDCSLGIEGVMLADDITASLPDKEWAWSPHAGETEEQLQHRIEEHVRIMREEKQREEGEQKRKMSEWFEFCRYVKHQRRYFLHSSIEESLPADVLGILKDIGETAKPIPCKTIYRARVGRFDLEKDIREPRPEDALMPNRMSPAGIPVFYGCNTPELALRETYNKPYVQDGNIVTVGKFQVIDPESVCVFDLVGLDAQSSSVMQRVIDALHEMSDKNKAKRFLRLFAREIAKPVYGKEQHIEYVPTQVITEYLRASPSFADKKPRGILYPSVHRSDTPPNGEGWFCAALFNSRCLKFIGMSHYRARPKFEPIQKPSDTK